MLHFSILDEQTLFLVSSDSGANGHEDLPHKALPALWQPMVVSGWGPLTVGPVKLPTLRHAARRLEIHHPTVRSRIGFDWQPTVLERSLDTDVTDKIERRYTFIGCC